jgi:hypothetical protein
VTSRCAGSEQQAICDLSQHRALAHSEVLRPYSARSRTRSRWSSRCRDEKLAVCPAFQSSLSNPPYNINTRWSGVLRDYAFFPPPVAVSCGFDSPDSEVRPVRGTYIKQCSFPLSSRCALVRASQRSKTGRHALPFWFGLGTVCLVVAARNSHNITSSLYSVFTFWEPLMSFISVEPQSRVLLESHTNSLLAQFNTKLRILTDRYLVFFRERSIKISATSRTPYTNHLILRRSIEVK